MSPTTSLLRRLEADLAHRLLEEQAVFGLLDGLDLRADHLDAVLVENARLGKLDGKIQRRLTAHGRQQRIRPLALDDGFDELHGQRLDVGAVRQFRIRHDRGRVRIDQDDLVALFAQGLARLRSRIVELARLTDDDRTGADDQDLGNVGSLGICPLRFHHLKNFSNR